MLEFRRFFVTFIALHIRRGSKILRANVTQNYKADTEKYSRKKMHII